MGRLRCARARHFPSVLRHDKLPGDPGRRNGGGGVLVRVREHLFLPGGAPGRRARRGAGRESRAGARSCSGRSSLRRAGGTRRSTSIPPRAAICGATSSGPARRWASRSNGLSPFPNRACSPPASRWRLRARSAQTFPVRSTWLNSASGLSIADRATLASLLAACGIDPTATLERAESDANKAALKAECARAAEIGIVGAPSIVTATARCSGATIGSNRGSIGRRERASEARSTVPDVRRQSGV